MATATEPVVLGLNRDAGPMASPVVVTEKAAEEVRRAMADVSAAGSVEEGGKLYLRVRVQGGGCSGFQNKLDLDHNYNEKTDHLFEMHGVAVVVDKRSLLYLEGAVIDFHDDLNKRGFTVSNPNAKSTCGCGSSYSM